MSDKRTSRGRPPKKDPSIVHRKQTEHINNSDAENLRLAIGYARGFLYQPMTLHITVKWDLIPQEEGSSLSDHDRLSSLIDRMGKWLRRRTGKKAVWARVIEPNAGDGFHVHMLVHVPEKDQRDFQAAFTGWLAKDASGLDYSNPKKLPVKFVTILKNQIQAHGLFKYLVKEGDEEVHASQGLEPHLRAQRTGKPIEGKRVKVSQSIDKTARKAALKVENRAK